MTSLTLHKVLEQGSLADVKAILEDECVHACRQSHVCIVYQAFVSLAVCLHRPHLLDVPDQHGYSPLMVTCHHGNLDLVDYLLHTGANVEFQNADGRTRWVRLVLHYSIGHRYSSRCLQSLHACARHSWSKLKNFDV